MADVTITGTVGELGIQPQGQFSYPYIRFKMTDPNQTKTCTSVPGYAFIIEFAGQNCQAGDCAYKELYAMLLVSKKGAPITCTVDTNTSCHITSCTLP